jgi:hypothetical protein
MGEIERGGQLPHRGLGRCQRALARCLVAAQEHWLPARPRAERIDQHLVDLLTQQAIPARLAKKVEEVSQRGRIDSKLGAASRAIR